MRASKKILTFVLLSLPVAAAASELPPAFGRYMPLFPGLYGTLGVYQDDRDSVFDRSGAERDSASPNAGGRTAFPEKTAIGELMWHFPMFETYRVPFFSARTHFAKVRLSFTETRTEGRLDEFAADPSDDASTEADRLENSGSGNGDLAMEFGSYVYGSPAAGWRARRSTPLAVLASGSLILPFGAYNRDAPVSAGSNTASIQGRLGVHWQPWAGGLIDYGMAYREYFQNYDAAFGRTMPTQQGDDKTWDLSVAQRLLPGLHVAVFGLRRDGAPNRYDSPRFAVNVPQPMVMGNSTAPAPGTYTDGGTGLTTFGIGLNYFVTQRWLAALQYMHPHSGRSGEFDLPYNEHTPAGCKNGAPTCTTMPAGSVRVDGLGPARSYASDRLVLTLTHNFGLGDTYTCPGCKP